MPSRNISLGLGVLALLTGLLLAVMWFRKPAPLTGTVATKIPTAFILVAAKAIPAGRLVRAKDMTWHEVSAIQVTGGSIVGGNPANAGTQNAALVAGYVGAAARHAFAAQAPLTSDGLVKPGNIDFLGVALRPGYRAVSINVDAAQSASGLIAPDDRVDVILTQSFPVQGNDASRRSVGETVLHALRVIAVDQRLGPTAATSPVALARAQTPIPKTVTLEVTPHQAEVLLVAEQLGKIQLSLLGKVDQNAARPKVSTPVPPAWASDVSPATAAPRAAGTSGGRIAVMRGGAKTEFLCETSAGLLPCP